MVLFTITPSIVEGLKARNEMPPSAETSDEKSSFEDAAVGSPISHEQIVDLWKHLKAKRDGNCHLEDLLRGSRVYVPPPAPKPEPVRLPQIRASGGRCLLIRIAVKRVQSPYGPTSIRRRRTRI